MKAWVSNLLKAVVALVAVIGIILFLDHRIVQKPPRIVVETKVDTLILHDTIVAVKPKYITVRVKDTIRVPVPVGAGKDTVWAELPREEKVYQDSTYRAVVSGYLPSLDTISVFRKTVFIDKETTKTVYIQPSRFSIGVQAGYGFTKSGLSPYVGVGVQYNLWSPKRRTTPP